MTVTRAWIACRRAVPAAAFALVVAFPGTIFFSTKGAQLGHWHGSEAPFSLPYVNIFGFLGALGAAVIIRSTTAVWERNYRGYKRLARAQMLTWLLAVLIPSSVGPIVTALRLSYTPHPWSVLSAHIVLASLATACVSAFDGFLGSIIAAATAVATIASEAFSRAYPLITDPFRTPALLAPFLSALLALWIEARTRGVPWHTVSFIGSD